VAAQKNRRLIDSGRGDVGLWAAASCWRAHSIEQAAAAQRRAVSWRCAAPARTRASPRFFASSSNISSSGCATCAARLRTYSPLAAAAAFRGALHFLRYFALRRHRLLFMKCRAD